MELEHIRASFGIAKSVMLKRRYLCMLQDTERYLLISGVPDEQMNAYHYVGRTYRLGSGGGLYSLFPKHPSQTMGLLKFQQLEPGVICNERR